MLSKTKMMIVAAFVLGSASAASAQSYDPSVGTGNLVPYAAQTRVLLNSFGARGVDAYANVTSGIQPNTRGPTADEKALCDSTRPEYRTHATNAKWPARRAGP